MADKLTLDKQAMKDAATAHLRIYVGGLTDDTTTEDLYNHFIEYGEIDGIVTNKVFGFVQFKNESSAQEAINKANGSLLKGKKLTVRTAQKNNPKRDMDTSGHMDKSMSVNSHDGPAINDNDESYDAYGNYVGEQNYRDEEGYEEGYSRGGQRGRGRGRKRGRGAGGFRDRSPQRNDWSDRNYDRFSTEYPRTLPVTERNDCEIIVVSKTLTEYAEYIETRLKRLGIVVDLLFPMEDVPIGKVLGNIASRGCLYAILVMPPNLEHRSLTLTILHGMPQEHRNMALEDALQLLSRNFQEVQRGGATGREAVYALLGQLADGKSLTVSQLDKVIEYLKARREKQAKIEMGDPSTTQPTNKTQEELQQRILNILNEKKAEPAPPPQPPKQDTQNKLLNNPTVRKALDSILQKLV